MFSSFFFYFSIEQTPSFPKFVSWCIENYSSYEGMIMDASRSRILCPINSLNIQNTLPIPSKFIQLSSEYNGEILRFFQESSDEQKNAFLKASLKPESQLSNPPLPIDFSLFNEENQSVTILASQFLGLDSNWFVTEPLLSLSFTHISS